jgi:O-antigen ligase
MEGVLEPPAPGRAGRAPGDGVNASSRIARTARAAAALIWTLGVALCASVAASQILLGAAALAALLVPRGSTARLRLPPGNLALALFAGWTLLSALLSPTPLHSLWQSKELLLLGVPALGASLLLGAREVERAAVAALAAGVILALWGVGEYFRGLPNPFVRIRGPLSQHLTYAGLVMLLLVAAAGWSASTSPALRRTSLLALAPLAAALLLNQSRSAWLGACAGLTALALPMPRRCGALGSGSTPGVRTAPAVPRPAQPRFLRRFQVPLGLLLAGALAVALFPELRQRALSLIEPGGDTSVKARDAMLLTGGLIIHESPWLGTGPGGIPAAYARLQADYSSLPEYFPLPQVQHLHSNMMQIAAERGVPALAAWLAFWVMYAWGLARMPQDAVGLARPELRITACACIMAFIVMGFFEYNFGDAEPSTLLLGLLALPFARGGG